MVYSSSFNNGEIVSYEWIFGVGAEPATGTGVTPSVSYSSPGEKTIVLTITTDLGCKVTEVVESLVTVNACCLEADITSEFTEILLGTSADLNSEFSMANGEVTYQWLPSDILSCTDCPNPTITPIEDVSVTDVAITSTSDFTQFFEGDSAKLEANISEATGQVMYLWSPEDILSCSDCPDPTITPSEDVTVSLLIMDEQGCEATDTIVIDVFFRDSCTLDVIIESGLSTIPCGDSTNLNAIVSKEIGEVSYQWSPEDILSCSDCPESVITPTENVTTTLIITDEQGCEATDTLEIEIEIEEIAIPSAFTPDGDGTNDCFKILGGGPKDVIVSFQIYSRWGNLVYEENREQGIKDSSCWNGTYKGEGERLQPDVYIYHIVVIREDLNGQEVPYTGDITLIR